MKPDLTHAACQAFSSDTQQSLAQNGRNHCDDAKQSKGNQVWSNLTGRVILHSDVTQLITAVCRRSR